MILSVHATFGAAVSAMIPSHPLAGFVLGFASHFVLDAIPHKDYDLLSVESTPDCKMKLAETIYKKFRLMRDMAVVSLDALVGLSLAFLFFFNPTHPFVFLAGALGALLPDFLSFLYLLFKHKPLVMFFELHASVVHSKVILKLNQITGVLVQFCTITVLIAIMYGVRGFL